MSEREIWVVELKRRKPEGEWPWEVGEGFPHLSAALEARASLSNSDWEARVVRYVPEVKP